MCWLPRVPQETGDDKGPDSNGKVRRCESSSLLQIAMLARHMHTYHAGLHCGTPEAVSCDSC
jgi:hypothetical protein